MNTKVRAVIKDLTIWVAWSVGYLAFFALMGWAWSDMVPMLALTGVGWVWLNASRRAKAVKSAPNP